MVTTECKDTIEAPILHCSTKVEGEIGCKCCEVLKLKLKKTLSEFSSAWEIIRGLQKEGNIGEWMERESMSQLKVYQERKPTLNEENVSKWAEVK
jgi:hypothetical protein